MGTRDLYTVQALDETRMKFRVSKHDQIVHFEQGDYEVERKPAGYMTCTCFAATRSTCRHREMVLIFEDAKRLNTGALYNYDKKKWVDL